MRQRSLAAGVAALAFFRCYHAPAASRRRFRQSPYACMLVGFAPDGSTDTIARALPDIRSRLPAMGLEASLNSPEQFGSQLRAEITKWAKVVKESGARTN